MIPIPLVLRPSPGAYLPLGSEPPRPAGQLLLLALALPPVLVCSACAAPSSSARLALPASCWPRSRFGGACTALVVSSWCGGLVCVGLVIYFKIERNVYLAPSNIKHTGHTGATRGALVGRPHSAQVAHRPRPSLTTVFAVGVVCFGFALLRSMVRMTRPSPVPPICLAIAGSFAKTSLVTRKKGRDDQTHSARWSEAHFTDLT